MELKHREKKTAAGTMPTAVSMSVYARNADARADSLRLLVLQQ
jgi:hypothetical protein